MTQNVTVKCVMVGDSGVGKSALALSFVKGYVPRNITSTIGTSFLVQNVYVGKHKIPIEIWDTAGQERYRCLTRLYYRDANVVLIMFDLSLPIQKKNIYYWINEINENCECTKNYIIGTKNDLPINLETYKKLINIAQKKQLDFISTSAITRKNINTLFSQIAQTQLPKIKINKNKIQIQEKQLENASLLKMFCC